MRTGFSAASASAGYHARSAMPSVTGAITSTATSSTLPTGGGTCASAPRNHDSASAVHSGSVSRASRLLMAVSVMLSATSPRAMWLNRLAVTPPGEAASSTRPSASSPGSLKARHSPMATGGSSRVCTTSATATARGNCSTRRKSASVRCRPSPAITTASAMGRNTTRIALSAMAVRRR